MRRTVMIVLVVIGCLLVAWHGLRTVDRTDRVADRTDLRVLLAYAPSMLDEYGYVLDAWRSVMEEEGVAVEVLDMYTLQDADPSAVAVSAPALILPDGVCRSLFSSFGPWVESYLQAGGSILAVHDAGVRSQKGAYLPRSWLAGVTGVLAVDYNDLGDASFTTAAIRFEDAAAAELCGIPPGKLDETLHLTGYGYGRLEYPVTGSRVIDSYGLNVLAWAETPAGDLPAVTVRRHGEGLAGYVSLPLGHLKAHADDLPLRSLLRWWLFDELGLPHLLNVENGVGAVVFNWHIDSNSEWTVIDSMLRDGLVREGLPTSVHVCAGADLNEPGDAMGFDAGGRGRGYLERLAPLAEIGSHGGWSHNLFAREVASGRWGESEVRDALRRNIECLSGVVSRPIVEYSAPAGVHPPQLMTGILEDFGFTSYYFTGDGGSAPNRSFADGAMLSTELIAFPVMPLRDVASFGEMESGPGLAAAEVADWLQGVSDFCEHQRTVRLVYSHPYNLYQYHGDLNYRPAFSAWLDDLERRRDAGLLSMTTMKDHAAFLQRMLNVEFRWVRDRGGLRVELHSEEGLAGISFALPAARYQPPSGEGLRTVTSDAWHVVVIEDETVDVVVDCRGR